MHDNAPSQSAMATVENRMQREQIDDLASLFSGFVPDWDSFGDSQTSRVHQSGQRFTSNDRLWAEIVKCAYEITEDNILKLTESMDQRLFVIQNDRGYIYFHL